MKRLLPLLLLLGVSNLAFSQINSFPWTEDFESEALCGTGCGAVCNTMTQMVNLTTDDLDFSVDLDGTASGNTGPDVDHTFGNATGQYVYVETSCNNTGYPFKFATLESPYFDLTGIPGSMEFGFWYHSFGNTQGTLRVNVRIGSNGAWSNIAGPFQDNQDLWQESIACIGAPYVGSDSVQFDFEYVSGTGFTGDLALDDISFRIIDPNDAALVDIVAPSGCGLSATEPITITIQNVGGDTIDNGSNLSVSYQIDGGAIVTETMTIASDLTGLCGSSDMQTYTFTTLADLSVPGNHNILAWVVYTGDVNGSNDSDILTTNTAVLVNGIPYIQDFESGLGGWTIDNSTNGSWFFGNPNLNIINGAASGTLAFSTGGNGNGTYNANENSSVESPCLDISSATGSEYIALKIWHESEDSWDGANLFASYDDGLTWNQVGAFGTGSNWYNDNSINSNPGGSQEGWTGTGATGAGGWLCAQHKLDSIDLINSTSLRLRVNFASDGNVQVDGFAFDDVAVGIPAPYNALADTLTTCDTLVQLDAGAGYNYYLWSTGETTQTIMASSSGTYFVTVSDAGLMCARDQVYVDIINLVQPNLNDMTICPGGNVTFDAQGGSNTSYLWGNGDATQTSTYSAAGNVTVVKTDTVTGCFAIDSAVVTVSTPVSISDTSACEGTTITMDASAPNSIYTWSTGATTPTVDITTTTTLVVSVFNTQGGCFSVDTAIVTINPTPSINISDTTVCGSITLDAGAGYTSYDWSTGNTTQTETVTSTATLSVTVFDVFGCTNTASAIVTVNDAPVVDLGGDQLLCVEDNLTLDAGNSGSTFSWSNTETTQTILVDGTVTGVGTFPYSVTVIGSNGCAATDLVTITVDSCLSVQEINIGLEVNLYPNPTNGLATISIEDINQSDLTLSIVSIEGKLIQKHQLTNRNTSYLVELDLTSLEAGIYFVQFQNEHGTIARRIIKE